jgi:hypothetical protein
MIAWDTNTHEFRMGQWFKGRIYEHRCDLSPSGEKLIYFAAKHRAPLFTWTAVSRPPFLTALAMWPKGDSWGGGGLFKNERTISLNHLKSQFDLAEGFKLPRAMTVEPCGKYSGQGEDAPILPQRLSRDGWSLRQNAEGWKKTSNSRIWYEPSKNETWTKSNGAWTLEMSTIGMHETRWPLVRDAASDLGLARRCCPRPGSHRLGGLVSLGRTTLRTSGLPLPPNYQRQCGARYPGRVDRSA